MTKRIANLRATVDLLREYHAEKDKLNERGHPATEADLERVRGELAKAVHKIKRERKSV
jgi:hypothetical protein